MRTPQQNQTNGILEIQAQIQKQIKQLSQMMQTIENYKGTLAGPTPQGNRFAIVAIDRNCKR